jgi:hypothetical protein
MSVNKKLVLARLVYAVCIAFVSLACLPAVAQSQNPIQSVIVSEFDGLDNGNLYELQNGQIWKQTEYWIWVWVWVRPSVIIYMESGAWKMKVENIDHAVTVERLK